MDEARALFREYADWLAVDLCFQGFAEELASLPGAYAPPRGCLLLAGPAGAAIGCIALRPIAVDGTADGAVGEIKRLFVQPAARGQGLGERLVAAIVDIARAAGYRELKLDTLLHMTDARRLYERLGFAPCSPYYHNPLPGAVYLSRTL
ncbi:MAG: GNAT family N-acetyltransferase [Betaproteobacteria bacterium]|nr:GNAT family N-acetyltransferase [Betaproteobacteria bacterium]MCC7217946.1 GNAT family N-acetyltransferase [Burkholderiales bacterium]